jgi:hypothetical protein
VLMYVQYIYICFRLLHAPASFTGLPVEQCATGPCISGIRNAGACMEDLRATAICDSAPD